MWGVKPANAKLVAGILVWFDLKLCTCYCFEGQMRIILAIRLLDKLTL